MSKEKPADDEPGRGKVRRSPRKSTKSEVTKAAVVARRIEGASKSQIAREEGIDRRTVDNILEEADMDAVLVDCGYSNAAIVKNHLEPLLSATRSGMYGRDIAGATRLGALRLIDKWKGITAKTQAKIQAKVRDAGTTNGPSTFTVRLVVADETRAARLARLLSPDGAVDVRTGVDAQVDQNVG